MNKENIESQNQKKPSDDCISLKQAIKDRVSELQMMQIQAGDDFEFCEQMEYAIKELRKFY